MYSRGVMKFIGHKLLTVMAMTTDMSCDVFKQRSIGQLTEFRRRKKLYLGKGILVNKIICSEMVHDQQHWQSKLSLSKCLKVLSVVHVKEQNIFYSVLTKERIFRKRTDNPLTYKPTIIYLFHDKDLVHCHPAI